MNNNNYISINKNYRKKYNPDIISLMKEQEEKRKKYYKPGLKGYKLIIKNKKLPILNKNDKNVKEKLLVCKNEKLNKQELNNRILKIKNERNYSKNITLENPKEKKEKEEKYKKLFEFKNQSLLKKCDTSEYLNDFQDVKKNSQNFFRKKQEELNKCKRDIKAILNYYKK